MRLKETTRPPALCLGLLALCLAWCLPAGGVTAQYANGDVVIAANLHTSGPGVLIGVKPGGAVYTVAQSLPLLPWDICPAPDNRSLWLVGYGSGPTTGAQIVPDGTITSLFSTLPGILPTGLDVDDAGCAIITDVSAGRVLRYAGGTFTTVYFRVWGSVDSAIDLATGDLIMSDHRVIFRAALNGGPHVTTLALVPIPTMRPGLHSDPTTGDMLLTWWTQLLRVRVKGSPVMTTVASGIGTTELVKLDRDPRDGTFVFPEIGPNARLFRYSPHTGTVTTVTALPIPLRPGAVTVAGSRHLAAITPPLLGKPYRLRVSSPSEPGRPYVVALSFGFRPGIPLGNGRIVHLNPDALFRYSLTNTGIFSGFQGTLNTAGEGFPILRIPRLKALSGLRLFAAAMTLDAGKPSVISDPIGFTIR